MYFFWEDSLEEEENYTLQVDTTHRHMPWDISFLWEGSGNLPLVGHSAHGGKWNSSCPLSLLLQAPSYFTWYLGTEQRAWNPESGWGNLKQRNVHRWQKHLKDKKRRCVHWKIMEGTMNVVGRKTTPWQAVDTTWEFREERLYSSDSATMMNRFDVIKLLNYLSDGSVVSISLWFRLWHLQKPHYKNRVGAYFNCKQSI